MTNPWTAIVAVLGIFAILVAYAGLILALSHWPRMLFLLLIPLVYGVLTWIWPPLIRVTRVSLHGLKPELVLEETVGRGETILSETIVTPPGSHVDLYVVDSRLHVNRVLTEAGLVLWFTTVVALLAYRRAHVNPGAAPGHTAAKEAGGSTPWPDTRGGRPAEGDQVLPT
jgi:hypothetical protein